MIPRLGEARSPERDWLVAQNRVLRLSDMLEQNHTILAISRWGEELSPERDALSPKKWALRLSERLEKNQGRVSDILA